MQEQTKQVFQIYRDGQLSRIETYKPILKQKLINFGNKIDRFIVEGHWPQADSEQVSS